MGKAHTSNWLVRLAGLLAELLAGWLGWWLTDWELAHHTRYHYSLLSGV